MYDLLESAWRCGKLTEISEPLVYNPSATSYHEPTHQRLTLAPSSAMVVRHLRPRIAPCNGVVPIEQAGEKREADPYYKINAPRLDPSLDVLGELLSED